MLTSKPPFFLPAHDSLLAKEHQEPFGLSVHSTTGMLRLGAGTHRGKTEQQMHFLFTAENKNLTTPGQLKRESYVKPYDRVAALCKGRSWSQRDKI